MGKINQELDDIFSTLEFEEDGGIYITGADWYADDLNVRFTVKTGVFGQNQLWEVQVRGVRDELIKSEIINTIELLDEHPLLWTYKQRQVSLYFGRPTTRPYELFANIYAIHARETQKSIPFNTYFNQHLPAIDLCKSPSGLFLNGPIKLLEAYRDELKSHGMNPTILDGHHPKRWLNGHYVDETEKLSVLIMGGSYVIGETFDFKRV